MRRVQWARQSSGEGSSAPGAFGDQSIQLAVIGAPAARVSASFLYHEPLALLIGETECVRGGGFRHFMGRRIHIAEDLGAVANQ